jgi:hypothetical protein
MQDRRDALHASNAPRRRAGSMPGEKTMSHRSLVRGAAFAFALCFASTAMAQAKPKKPKTPAAKPAEEKPPEPAPEPVAPEPASAADAPVEPKTDSKPTNVEPPAEAWDDTDVTEKPGKTYYFIGLRYRGTIVPKFILNLFVDEGKTFYTNTIGIEGDIRKDGFSFIPALSYVEYGTGDILFKEKGKEDVSNNWSVVNSSLKAIYITADLLWSTKVHPNWDFEYGAGFGLGVLFGNLQNNWLYGDPNGPYKREDGVSYSRCQTEGNGDVPGYFGGKSVANTCQRVAHSNAAEAKVGGYEEKFWTGGGSVPNVFIHLAIPQIGVRFKPRKDLQARLGLGFSLTGFWFGLSANYGLETALEKPKAGATTTTGKSGPTLLTGQSALNMPLGF